MMRLKKKPTIFMRQQNEDEVGPSYNPYEIEDLAKEIKSWARTEWENIRMTEGSLLPKISMNRKVKLLIKQAN